MEVGHVDASLQTTTKKTKKKRTRDSLDGGDLGVKHFLHLGEALLVAFLAPLHAPLAGDVGEFDTFGDGRHTCNVLCVRCVVEVWGRGGGKGSKKREGCGRGII